MRLFLCILSMLLSMTDSVMGMSCAYAGVLKSEVLLSGDFRGLTVCRKQGGLVTDYVYDDFGELRYVLPPALSGTAKRTDADMQRYAYWYDYDERGRLVSKKLPGLREWLFRYDIVDRLGAELSPHQEAGVWRLYCYDNADRQVIAFDCRMTDAEATEFAWQTNTAEPDWAAFHGYAVPDVPDEAEVAWARFYDNYQFISDNRLGPEYGWKEDSSPGWVYSEYSPSSKGLLTGVYDGKNFESYHYNTDGQMIQSYSAGFNKGRTNYVYTYSGQLLKTVHDPCEAGLPKVTEEYDYDVMGRQTGLRVLLHDSNTARTDTARMDMAYNSLGQLCSRAFGACCQDFTYDIHGWLRSSETTTGELRNQLSGGTLVKVPKVISEKLEYAEGLFPRYNGNISSKVMDGEVYSYSYDGNNRLTSASMYRSNADRFSATYGYDAMSNLTSVKRRGIVDMVDMDGPKMESYGTLDDISISYDGNRISSVTAKSDAVAFEGMTGMGRNESDMSVSYDDAGRIVSDETRGITLIEYNNDGHPVRMVLDEGHEFHDAWDNFGNHLSTTIYMMQPSGVLNELPLLVKEYRGNGQIITSAPALGGHRHVMTRFAGGYFSDGEVYYYVTDYQGNNVAVVDGDGKIVEQTNYYPYGEPWREATEQPFLYAGNERLRLFGLNEYDFLARRYNPLLASFTTWDPLAEKYPWLSPYAYCAGNPINYIDPNGEDWSIYSYRDEDDKLHIMMKITGVVYNASNEKFDMGAVRDAISSQIEDVFTFSGEGFSVSMTTDIRAVSSVDEVNDKDHVFAIVDQSTLYDETSVANAKPNGLSIRLGSDVVNQTLSGNNLRTIAHELGHTAGLHHTNDIRNKLPIVNRHTNLMTQTRYAEMKNNRNIEINQLNSIIQSFNRGCLNQGHSTYNKVTFSGQWPFIRTNTYINF